MAVCRRRFLPSLVVLALAVCNQVVLSFEPFCAFDAVPLTQAWKVFGCFCGLILCEVLFGREICLDQIEVSVWQNCDQRALHPSRRLIAYLVRRLVLLRLMLPMIDDRFTELKSYWKELNGLNARQRFTWQPFQKFSKFMIWRRLGRCGQVRSKLPRALKAGDRFLFSYHGQMLSAI